MNGPRRHLETLVRRSAATTDRSRRQPLAACVAALVGKRTGVTWAQAQKGITDGIAVGLAPILILLSVGMLIGTWILCGTVPAMIYYGVQILDPGILYAASAVICAIVAISIGSSWTVAGTLGIGLMGIAAALDLSLPISAGAIISGAYFGDKLSPLSETTNLAAAVTSNNLFDHIQHMLWTTIPGFVIALVIFFILGIGSGSNVVINDIEILQAAMQETFTINPLMLAPLILLLGMAVRKLPALSTLICGTLAGCLFAIIFQWDVVVALAADESLAAPAAVFKGLFSAMFLGYSSVTGNEALDSLLSKGA